MAEIITGNAVIANGDNAVRWKALAAGAVAFFIKPARGNEFIASIRSALRRELSLVRN